MLAWLTLNVHLAPAQDHIMIQLILQRWGHKLSQPECQATAALGSAVMPA